MAQYILCNRVTLDGIEWKAGRVVDDSQYDVARVRLAGGVLVAMPNAILEERAALVRKQELRGLRDGEIDLLGAVVAQVIGEGDGGDVTAPQTSWAGGFTRTVNIDASAATNGTTAQLLVVDLPDETVVGIDVIVTARSQSSPVAARFNLSQAYVRSAGGAPAALGANVSASPVGTSGGAPPAGCDASIAPSGNSAVLSVTGPAGALAWKAIAQITYS